MKHGGHKPKQDKPKKRCKLRVSDSQHPRSFLGPASAQQALVLEGQKFNQLLGPGLQSRHNFVYTNIHTYTYKFAFIKERERERPTFLFPSFFPLLSSSGREEKLGNEYPTSEKERARARTLSPRPSPRTACVLCGRGTSVRRAPVI